MDGPEIDGASAQRAQRWYMRWAGAWCAVAAGLCLSIFTGVAWLTKAWALAAITLVAWHIVSGLMAHRSRAARQ